MRLANVYRHESLRIRHDPGLLKDARQGASEANGWYR